MQYSKLGSINYPKYSENNNLNTQYILVMLHPKAMAQAKPSQSQSLALAFGLAWRFSEPRPPQAKPKPLAFRPSQARTSLLGAFIFFDRNNKTHSDPAVVMRTLVHRLASFDSRIQSAVSAEIEDDRSPHRAAIRKPIARATEIHC
jgi:hypothetical protein